VVGVVASQVVPVSFAKDAAKRTNELPLGGVDKVFSGVDSSGVEPNLHPPIDSAELGEFEVAEPMDKVLLLENHESIWFFKIGGEFGEEGIWGSAFRRCYKPCQSVARFRRRLLPFRGRQRKRGGYL